MADLATERERQLTTARAKQTTGLTNGRAANWAPKVEFSPFRALSHHQRSVAKSAYRVYMSRQVSLLSEIPVAKAQVSVCWPASPLI